MAGLAVKPRLLDPRECVACFLHARNNLPRDTAYRLLGESRGRTSLFVESFLLAPEDLSHVKDELNSHVLQALPSLVHRLERDDDALPFLAYANAVDYRMPWFQDRPLGGEPYRAVVDRHAIEYASKASSIAILLDNAGEAVIDIAYALVKAERGVRVYLVARSREYETDVTYAEARRLLYDVAEVLGLEAGRVELVGTGSHYPAPHHRDRLAKVLDNVDLVISKGIANFEALMEKCWPEPERTVIALRAKCPPVARATGAMLGDAVVKQGYRCILRG